MKKMTCLLLVLLMAGSLLAGCGAPNKSVTAADEPADSPAENLSDEPADEPAQAPVSNGASGSGGTAAESYTAYLEAKNNVITKITDGMTTNPETGLAALAFLGVAMIDLAVLPASFFGMGQESVQIGLAMMGAADVQYTESGNSYSVTYSNKDGKKLVFSGSYDAAADALACTGSTDGKENIYSEYRRTPYGYAGQYWFLNDDGTTSVYMIAVDGENGTVGISTAAGKPAALTGGEGPDFPKACAEWYSVYGTTITGKTSDGTDLNFEYTPTENE